MRRAVCAFMLGSWLWPAVAAGAAPATPNAVVAAIYAFEAAESKKPSPGTAFTTRPVRAKYFSKGFDRLITQAEIKSEKEQEPGPVDFDPVISGQDGEVKRLKVDADRVAADTAVVSAHFLSFGHPTVVTYDLVKEDDGWKVDDIKGRIETHSWSIRKILEDAARK